MVISVFERVKALLLKEPAIESPGQTLFSVSQIPPVKWEP